VTIIKSSIHYPVTTTVGVILVCLFGGIAYRSLPIQLTPNVERPQVTVQTVWPGASPQEIERTIVDEQEEQLKSLEGLTKMESSSEDSVGTIVLTFQVGTPLDSALLKVSNRLQQVQSYPIDAEKPVIRTVDADANALAWYVLMPGGPNAFTGDISTLFDFADDFIKPEFERVPGIAQSNIYGGREHEMHVLFNPAQLAARRVTLNEMADALERENRNYSGGDFDEGKRRYVVRTVGDYRSAEDIDTLVVATRNGQPIYLKDVARAELGFRKPVAQVFEFGQVVLAMNAVKTPGANALNVMTALEGSVDRINRELLAPRGLTLVQVYDQTHYINSAIGLVKESLVVGGFLTFLVLLVFLRSWSSTLVIALAMPISLIGSFIVMAWMGRTVNVVSLAGMAFAIGIVVDDAIVVLENIYRHRQMGKSLRTAAYDGAAEVWGAVLASTLTNMAVFIPVVFIREEAGQLFGDIAIAISASLGLSLLVSITVIPCLAARVLHTAEDDSARRGLHNLWGLVGKAEGWTGWVRDTVYWINGSTLRRLAVITVFTAIPIIGSLTLLPKAEYLPQGNDNFLFGILLPPPGSSLKEVASLHSIYQDKLANLWETPRDSAASRTLPGGGVQDFFFVALNNQAFMGVSARDPMRVRELIGPFNSANAEIPGAIAFTEQASIFSSGLGEGRSINVEISGPELERLIALGGEVFGQVMQIMPGSQARPIPSLDLDNPEVRIVIDRRRAADLGVVNRDLGFGVRALIDGAKASDYRFEGKKVDLRLMADTSTIHRTDTLDQLPIAAPDGQLVTLGSVADVIPTNGPVQINHSERQRTIAIQISPPETMPLQTAMDLVNTRILDPMKARGDLTGLYRVRLAGTADKLTQARSALYWNFLLALAITYLLMAALFESFLYPFVIMFSVPLAALGGVGGLWLMNVTLAYQPLDVLTMLGFILLVGTVVKNAILIVHQSLNHMRQEGMAPREAIRESVGNRMRPIFMSVATSVFGMLPLVLFPGAGSELYRGLGSVVVGGLIVSTVFTLFLVPSMFSLSLDIRAALVTRLRQVARFSDRPATGT